MIAVRLKLFHRKDASHTIDIVTLTLHWIIFDIMVYRKISTSYGKYGRNFVNDNNNFEMDCT